jgi:hypothetical protein
MDGLLAVCELHVENWPPDAQSKLLSKSSLLSKHPIAYQLDIRVGPLSLKTSSEPLMQYDIAYLNDIPNATNALCETLNYSFIYYNNHLHTDANTLRRTNMHTKNYKRIKISR